MKLSIILATYNRHELLKKTIFSIIKQSYFDFECLIIDDNPEDTLNDRYIRDTISDHRIKYYRRPIAYKKGLPGCRNFGLDRANGDYILFFDDDDILHPKCLESCINELEKNPIDFCRFERETFVDKVQNFKYEEEYETYQISKKELFDIISNKLPFNSCQVIWSKACFEKIRYDENLMYAEEWECYTRILLSGFRGLNICKTLMYARKHPDSNTGEYNTGRPLRINSHVMAIISVYREINESTYNYYGIKKHLINEFVRVSGKSNLSPLLRGRTNPIERGFWEFYSFIRPFRTIFFHLKKIK